MKRRDLLRWSAGAPAGLVLGAGFWRRAYAAPATPGPGPYGPLAAGPDANGLRLPAGFRSRVVATSGHPVAPTAHVWHFAPDGGACFAMPDGGWAYVSNSELATFLGGAAMIRFDAAGAVVEARTILGGTNRNCAGGPTPWGTWLSCEEWDLGQVWECFLDGRPAERRHDLGTFAHEAVAVDPARRRLYLTEDRPDGRFYRHTPGCWPDLSSGRLSAAKVTWDDAQQFGGTIKWNDVPDDISARTWPMSTYTTGFNGGEGCWYDDGLVYFTTKGDNRVWSYDASTERLEVVYDAALDPASPLRGVDNLVASKSSDLFVAEDGDNMQICLLTPEAPGGGRTVAPFLEIVGHEGSEVTGPAFTPAGDRLYFSSQRGPNGGGVGMTFEVQGPFRC